MKLLPANLGAEKKKLIALGVLVAVIPVAYWFSRSDDSSSAASAPTPVTASTPTPASAPLFGSAPPVHATPAPVRTPQGLVRGAARTTEDFKPSLKPKEGIDVTSIDPTLKLALLAKLRDLPMEGGGRSVFKEGAPPPPPAPPEVKIKPGPVVITENKPAEPPGPPKPPPPPPPTPIPLKFYGYANQSRAGHREAFFLDGEDIRIAGEDDVIRNRYKIIKIGVNSAVVEDTTDKHQQTLQLEPEQS